MHSRQQPNDAPPDHLMSPATQIIESSDDYLGNDQTELGRRVAPDKVELFAVADAASAVRDHLARQHSEFIVVHDVGASGGLRLLGSIATALRTPVQQLAIRRQGQGVPLATVRFVEIPGRRKRMLRVYSTDIDADTQARQQLATLLVGHSRLGALLIGHLPAHVLASQLQPLRQAVQKGPWINRHLLFVPSSASTDLASHATMLRGPEGPLVTVTAVATSLNQAWSTIAGVWNDLREGRLPASAPPSATSAPSPAPFPRPATPSIASGVPAPATPVPAAPPSATRADVPAAAVPLSTLPGPAGTLPMPAARHAPHPDNPLWARYLAACSEIKGLISACLMDVHGASLLTHAGARPGPQAMLEQGLAIYNAIARGGQALGLGQSQPDASIALTSHHLLLHPLPGHPGTVLHAVLDGSIANLTLARMHLQRVDTVVLGAQSPA